jgi:hypothetical protein
MGQPQQVDDCILLRCHRAGSVAPVAVAMLRQWAVADPV